MRNDPPAVVTQGATGEAAVHFVDVAEESGIDYENVSGSAAQGYILETISAGAAFLDVEGDGDQDLYLVNGTRLRDPPAAAGHRFYRHGGPGGGPLFEEATEEFGLAHTGWGMGCAVGDADNDGDPDLYVTYWGANRLYLNEGGEGFTEAGRPAGVADGGWGSSAAFGDLDGDGLLDLYVANYVEFDLADPPGGWLGCRYKGLSSYCGPQGIPGQADRLYRNLGGGRFAEAGEGAGISRHRLPGLGVVLSDLDADGDPDIYVANDSEPNLLFRNEGGFRFREIGAAAGLACSEDGRAQAGMGVHSGDYDRDGDFDLFVTNFSDDVNTLYANRGDGTFDDATHAAGLGGVVQPFLGWSTAFLDYDNDGWLDLFVANGHVYPQLRELPSGLRYAQRNLLYRNLGGRFEEVGAQAGGDWQAEGVSRDAAPPRWPTTTTTGTRTSCSSTSTTGRPCCATTAAAATAGSDWSWPPRPATRRGSGPGSSSGRRPPGRCGRCSGATASRPVTTPACSSASGRHRKWTASSCPGPRGPGTG